MVFSSFMSASAPAIAPRRERMDRAQLLQKIDASWEQLAAAVDGLPDPALTKPGTLGDWSAADLIGHIATWEEQAIRTASLLLVGRQPPRYSDINLFNALEVERKRLMSAEQVRAEFIETHLRLRRFVESLPEGLYAREGLFRRRLRAETTNHYKEHAAQLIGWRNLARG